MVHRKSPHQEFKKRPINKKVICPSSVQFKHYYCNVKIKKLYENKKNKFVFFKQFGYP